MVIIQVLGKQPVDDVGAIAAGDRAMYLHQATLIKIQCTWLTGSPFVSGSGCGL